VGSFTELLATRYPFASNGEPADLDNFAKFFGPDGVVATYYTEKLNNYVYEDGRLKPDAKAGVVPLEFCQSLGRADAIRRDFFASGSKDPSYVFRIRPNQPEDRPGHSANLPSVWVSVGGKKLTYEMGGRDWEDMTWPGPEPEDGARLGAPGTDGLAVQGIWGIFRILDQGKLGKSSDGSPQMRWKLERGGKLGPITVIYDFKKIPSGQLFESAVPPQR
jgi:type VI secretion system protein ImpL